MHKHEQATDYMFNHAVYFTERVLVNLYTSEVFFEHHQQI